MATLKLGAKYLVGPFQHIIYLSIGTCTFPTKWKLVRVLQLLKSSYLDWDVPKSYRPVSQLSVISKLVDCWVQSQLLQFLERTEQLNTDHHAYWANLSTLTALIKLIYTLAIAADENQIHIVSLINENNKAIATATATLTLTQTHYHTDTDTLSH